MTWRSSRKLKLGFDCLRHTRIPLAFHMWPGVDLDFFCVQTKLSIDVMYNGLFYWSRIVGTPKLVKVAQREKV